MVKKMAVLLALTLCFTLLGCSNIIKRIRDWAVLETFMQDYYAQLTMTSSDWSEVKEIFQDEPEYKECKFVNRFKGVVSETCIKRMVNDRQLPNYEMERSGIEAVTSEGLTLEKKYEGTYHDLEKDENVPFTIYDVEYTLKVVRNGTTSSYANRCEVRFITKDRSRRIDHVKGDFVWR